MRKRLATCVALLIILLLIGGCGIRRAGNEKQPAPAETAETPRKIVVQAPLAPATAPLFKIVKDGLLQGTGLELIIYKSVEEATARVVKGEADFTILPVNVAAKLYNRDVKISLANVSTWGILYLVSVDGSVKKWEDLKGSELYVGARGSTPDVLTQYLLRRSGLPEGSVKLTYLGSPEIAQLMINGLIKNAVLPEPLVTQVLLKNQQARVISDFFADWQKLEGKTTRLPQAGMIVRNEFARSYPIAVTGFQRAYTEAMEWTVTNPEKAALLVEANLQIPAPVFVKSLERTRLQFATGSKAKGDVQIYLTRLLEFSPDMVGGKIPDEKFFLVD
ncbi:MAG TPA: hypothetical protein DCK87_05455 [Desulfotomaculum sp.]|nr:hypothetical protein [Desulfotomaculum sp.]